MENHARHQVRQCFVHMQGLCMRSLDSTKIWTVKNGTYASYKEEEITSEPRTVTDHQQGEAVEKLSFLKK